MIRSGIVPIDELCQGFRARSTYILTGGAGAGKTTYSLQFLGQGLRSGETVVMLTHESRDDLFAHAEQLGLDLRPALREERAVVLRYRADFARRIARSGTSERVFDELRHLVSTHRPRRIVLDTFAPLLDDGSASPIAATALVELLERGQATSLLTYSDDLATRYDRRLEPLVQSAAGVFSLTRDNAGMRWVEIVSLRHQAAGSSGAGARQLVESLELR
jgi:KaiC/GvpD/RAD55 family RecA-like ATPase